MLDALGVLDPEAVLSPELVVDELVLEDLRRAVGGAQVLAARRLLARVAAADPGSFRRHGRADTAAASVCWMAARANDLLGGALTAKALMGWFGVSANTPSQRGRAMLAALGVEPADLAYSRLDLGSPEYLTADTRVRIIATRDRHQR